MYRGRYIVPFYRSYGTNGRKKFKNEVKASVGENAAIVRGKRLENVRVSKYERTNERKRMRMKTRTKVLISIVECCDEFEKENRVTCDWF